MFRKNRKNLIYLVVFLVPFLAFLFRSDVFTPLKFRVVRVIAAPVHVLSISLYEFKKILFYHRTFNEYMRLRRESDVLKSRLVGLEEVVRENSRLEQLLQFKRSMVYSSLTANVTGRDPSSWDSSITIDRGKRDGIRQGMPVISAAGVVGKIAEVGEQSSNVVLLTDPQFSVAALVQESRETGLVSGSLQGDICRMRFINADARINPGDKVITSRISTSFPEGLLIGEVIQIVGDIRKPSSECIIRPVVVFSQLEEVLVILQ
ncbi:MAG: rod shape-determining protein MreC [Candidatus Omnitrophica bacterium]|nr:rod shape-determining protein MreC [Candidatus Omnitrophota bacterium]